MSAADDGRAELRALAFELHGQAADAHTQGMALTRRASRIEQLADICTDDQVVDARDRFLEAGLLEVVELTGPGGNA